jgi:hypothetical protein
MALHNLQYTHQTQASVPVNLAEGDILGLGCDEPYASALISSGAETPESRNVFRGWFWPAGIACSKALAQAGHKVMVLDAGVTLEADRQQVKSKLAASAPSEWSPDSDGESDPACLAESACLSSLQMLNCPAARS